MRRSPRSNTANVLTSSSVEVHWYRPGDMVQPCNVKPELPTQPFGAEAFEASDGVRSVAGHDRFLDQQSRHDGDDRENDEWKIAHRHADYVPIDQTLHSET